MEEIQILLTLSCYTIKKAPVKIFFKIKKKKTSIIEGPKSLIKIILLELFLTVEVFHLYSSLLLCIFSIKLREAMISTGWCRLMPTLLQGSQEETEHDSVEKVVQAMSALAEACSTQFSTTRPTLQALLRKYSELAKEEQAASATGSDDFFSSIHSSLQHLVNQIHRDDF